MEEIRDLHNLALIKVNGGVIQYKLGSPAAALQLYETGLQLAMQIGAPAIESIVRNNLGEIYRELHRLPESVNELVKAISLCKASNDDLGLAEAYRQLAETYIVMGYLGKAEQACNQALEHSLLAGDPQTEAIAYRVFGQLAIAQGNDDIAANLVQKSIRMLGELGSNQELAHSLLVQAKVCSLRSQDLDARLLLEEARNLFQKVGATADEQKVEHLLEQLPLIVSVKDTVL
jgi:tetratricopeptide (TPR) repeat protein